MDSAYWNNSFLTSCPGIRGPCSIKVPIRCKGCDGLWRGVKSDTPVTNPKAAWFAQGGPVASPWNGCTHGSLEGSDFLPALEAELYVKHTGRHRYRHKYIQYTQYTLALSNTPHNRVCRAQHSTTGS